MTWHAEEIFGSYSRDHQALRHSQGALHAEVDKPLTLAAEILMQGCAVGLGQGSVGYRWVACKRSEATLL